MNTYSKEMCKVKRGQDMTREEREKAIEIIRKYECNAEHYEACEAIIKASEQDNILDKVKAEIEALPKTYPFVNHFDMYVKVSDVVKIINKYKERSEG